MKLFHFYELLTRRSSYPILFRGCDREKTGPLYRVIRISLLLTIILTGCATPHADKTVPKYDTKSTQDEVFQEIADTIDKSNKRTVAIIDFPHRESGKKIEKIEELVEKMAASLKKTIGKKKKKVWIRSGKSFMNVLETKRIIENGEIKDKERAKKLWQKMGIEVVITGSLVPGPNGTDYLIRLDDVQNDKMIEQLRGYWKGEDVATTRGGQSSGSIKTSDKEYRPQTPSAEEEISPDFFSHKPATLEDVGKALEKALRRDDFNNTAYLLVPEGFAIVSSPKKLKFSFDGTPIKETIDDNFLRLTKALENSSWLNRFKFSFVGPRPDLYQVVCVVVTSGQAYYEDEPEITFKKAKKLVVNGKGTTFPKELKNKKYNKDEHVCTALLYAFKEDSSGKIQFVSLSDFDNFNIRERLAKTGFWRK